MAKSKLNKEDAQELFESIKLSGEGWWRTVGVAVNAGAHTALGMSRKEFAQGIGQRMIDPRPAIIELHKEGHSQSAIADVLGISRDNTVARILAEEGLIEWTPSVERRAIEYGHRTGVDDAVDVDDNGHDDAVDPKLESLKTEVDALQVKLKAARNSAAREADKLRENAKKLREQLKKAKQDAKDAKAKAEATDSKDEARLRKEAEAYAEEQARKALAGMAHFVVDRATGSLREAADAIKELIEMEAVNSEAIRKIEEAHDEFKNEWMVAQAATSEEV